MAHEARDRLTAVCTAVGAAGIVVSAYVHYRLWDHSGYREIHLDRVLGVDLSRSIILQVVAGLAIAVGLVASLWLPRLRPWTALAGLAFSLGSLIAYYEVRTGTLLGFSERAWTDDAKLAAAAEVVAALSLGTVVARWAWSWRHHPGAAHA